MTQAALTPDFSRLFARWTDPETGIDSWLLDRHVAPLEQSFYFVNSGFSADARYLWFYCAAPPAPGRWLGVIDLVDQAVRGYPETGFVDASPMVLGDGTAMWTTEAALWQRGPGADDPVELVNEVPAELIGHDSSRNVPAKMIPRLATHLTVSSDGRGVLIDAYAGRENIVGLLPLDGSAFEVWHRGVRCHNHGQMCPIDPDLALLAWDFVTDPVTGENTPLENRLWLLRKGEAIRPIFDGPNKFGHEWWDRDGEQVWFVGQPPAELRSRPEDAQAVGGTWRVRIADRHLERMTTWFWHAHDSPCGRFVAGDRVIKTPGGKAFRGCSSSVHLARRGSDELMSIVSQNPQHVTPGRQYHIDPHPRFSPCGRYLTHTTTVRGRVELAVTEVDQAARTLG